MTRLHRGSSQVFVTVLGGAFDVSRDGREFILLINVNIRDITDE